MTENPCYKSGRKITVRGLMLHSVGYNQPRASVLIHSWNRADFGRACVHAFIDGNDGIVHQTLPWDHRGWHCASGPNGSGNNSHIGVEMCEPACIHYTSGSRFTISNLDEARACVTRTYNAAVKLFAHLCRQFGLNPLADGVIISHAEGHTRGIASDHGDPEHLWRGVGLPYTMDKFRHDVYEKMHTTAKPEKEKKPANTKTKAFRVRVSSNYLRIREHPTTESRSLGYTGAGTFTITETKKGKGSKSGWGHLKSGAGWISMDYVTKI